LQPLFAQCGPPGGHLSPSLALAVGVCALLGALLPLAIIVVTGELVGNVPDAVVQGSGSASAKNSLAALIAIGVLFIAGRQLTAIRATVSASLGRRLDQHLQERVMCAVNRPIGIGHLENLQTRELIYRAQEVGTGSYRAGLVVGPLATATSLWLQSLGSALLLAGFSVPLALGWFMAWAIADHFIRQEYLRSTRVATNQGQFVRRAAYLRQLAVTPGAGKEIRIWGMLGWLIDQFTAEWHRVMRPAWEERARGNRVSLITIVSLSAVHFFVLAMIGLAAARGQIDLASLVLYVGAVQGVGAIRNNLGTDAFALAYGTASVPAVLELERVTAEVEEHENHGGAVSPSGMPHNGIRFENVTFRYPGRETDVLRGLDLFIPAGRSLAIVGANGAGKTTLVKLLTRLYDPTEGCITVDDLDLRRMEPRAWQRRISAIFQDFIQYQLTARDNVVFGSIEHAADEARLLEAARKTGVLEMIEVLPRGWDTMLSREYRDGAELSGGQWQRLALARALFSVSSGAGVLVLDEPTANLDVRAEAALYESFLELTKGLTTIVISHRFSTVRQADRIVVLDGGRVLEDGTHPELLAQGGSYSQMFALQASRFLEEPVGG
jgi:ATP-binding cassette subfamily B protein